MAENACWEFGEGILFENQRNCIQVNMVLFKSWRNVDKGKRYAIRKATNMRSYLQFTLWVHPFALESF